MADKQMYIVSKKIPLLEEMRQRDVVVETRAMAVKELESYPETAGLLQAEENRVNVAFFLEGRRERLTIISFIGKHYYTIEASVRPCLVRLT